MSAWLWLLVPGTPLLAIMLLTYLSPRRCAGWLWLSCLPALVLSLWPAEPLVLPAFWPGAQWAAVDELGRAWLGFTALLWACASRFAVWDMISDARQQRFWMFWLLALLGNLLLVIALDAVSFYVGFTLMSLSAYGLVAHLRGPRPRQAGRLYLQLAVSGEMLIFAGMLLRIHQADGALLLSSWSSVPTDPLTAALLLVGFGLKAGFWPLHVWLPLAHPAAPAAASAVLSGAMIKAGMLGLWRFLPADDSLLQSWAGGLAAIGAVSALYGVVLGLLQSRAKTLLAYSSVSQMGYLLIILALGWQQPEARGAAGLLLGLYAVHHGLAKGALFMAAGLSSRVRLRPWHWLCLLLPTLALAGLPLTSGAAIKFLLKEGIETSSLAGWLFLLSIGSCGTTLLMLRLLWLLRLAQQQPGLPAMQPGRGRPWTLLCMMPILLPWLWPPLRTVILDSLPLYAVWAALWPALLALAISLLVWRSGWRLPQYLQGWPNPALTASIRLKRWLQWPPMPDLAPPVNRLLGRRSERQWNRLWRVDPVTASAWIVALLLLFGWLS